MKLITTILAVGALLLPISAQAEDKAKAKPTVVEIAVGNENFSTLVAAVKAAGLAEALSGEGPFTIFAPTNEAFAKVPKETLESLLQPENKDKLAAILKYHVVAGKVMAADVSAGKVKTLNGAKAEITVKGGKVMIDKANVVKTDIVGSNGVIHVIDSVILPAK
ncbi:MAG: fasciclin domain-containing protein [Akkermansiaceae bacterium]